MLKKSTFKKDTRRVSFFTKTFFCSMNLCFFATIKATFKLSSLLSIKAILQKFLPCKNEFRNIKNNWLFQRYAVFDVGAHKAQTSLYFNRLFKESTIRVRSISTIEILERNVSLYENIIAHNLGFEI